MLLHRQLFRCFSSGPSSPISSKLPLSSRLLLKNAKRIVVKLGTAVITRSDADTPLDKAFSEYGLQLGRLAGIVEEVSQMQNGGREMVVVTSGAVAFGKQILRSQSILEQTVRQTLLHSHHQRNGPSAKACAAVGQSGIMSLYEEMFKQYSVGCSQILVTKEDLLDNESRRALRSTLQELIRMRSIPVCNENDVMAKPIAEDLQANGVTLTDNDALAAMLAVEIEADLLVILSDVAGIYTLPPGHGNARLLDVFRPNVDEITLGVKSRVGRGGMEAKIKSAEWALQNGCAVVIANGAENSILGKVLSGKKVGTLLTYEQQTLTSSRVLAERAAAAGRRLSSLPAESRVNIITNLMKLLHQRTDDILAANQDDLIAARKDSINPSLISRLCLYDTKLGDIVSGMEHIASAAASSVGRVVRRTELANGLVLEQKTTPIGLILGVVDARPEVLPQLAALAIATGNGMLLRGGPEASNTNAVMHSIIVEALKTAGKDVEDACTLVPPREETLLELLEMEDLIHMVVPRGSLDIIKTVKNNTRIPVLGHSAGVCHVYIDKSANTDMAIAITVDSKCENATACNAAETILVHEALIDTFLPKLLLTLSYKGVRVLGGPRAHKELHLPQSNSLSDDHGDLTVTLEIIRSLDDAIDHINTYGSAHTDTIVTDDESAAAVFADKVDSACVFHNASTRFSDGYRFGLGAEVAISTSRLHARGPVGIDGLLTTKWSLKGNGHLVGTFNSGAAEYTHKPLPTK